MAAFADPGVRTPTEVEALLLSPGERWGWECVDVELLRKKFPEPVPTPAQRVPFDESGYQARVAQAQQARWTVYGHHPIAALLVVFLAPTFGATLLLSVTNQSTDSVLGGLIVGLAVLLWIVGGLLVAAILFRRVTAPNRVRQELDDSRRLHAEAEALAQNRSAAELAAFEGRRASFEVSETERLATLPSFGSVQLQTRVRRIDVFGEQSSWPKLLITLGGSAYGSGRELVVLDFTEIEVTTGLEGLLGSSSGRVSAFRLPDDAANCDLLAGLAPAEIKDVLVESLYGDVEQVTREQRSLADRALGEALEIIAPDITWRRLWRAVRALIGQEPPPDGVRADLTTEEWQSLVSVLGEDFRVRIGEQLLPLEAQLHALREFGENVTGAAGNASNVECFRLSRQGTTLANELVQDLLVQHAIRRLRRSQNGGRPVTVILAGADLIQERHLQRLDSQCSAGHVRLVLLFRDLREQRLEMAGSGGAVGFFRLTNAKQAEAAADWIGREHKFVLSQASVSRGTNESTTLGTTTTSGESIGESRVVEGPQFSVTETGSISTSTADSTSTSTGTSEQFSETYQRVEELLCRPTVLRTLPFGVLLLVEFAEGAQQRRIVAADVDPRLALSRLIGNEPLPADLAALSPAARLATGSG